MDLLKQWDPFSTETGRREGLKGGMDGFAAFRRTERNGPDTEGSGDGGGLRRGRVFSGRCIV